MIKTAITGNIAAGKSQVEKILISFGFYVVDTDDINSNLLSYNSAVINEIKSEFGEDIFSPQGLILKQKLGEIIFNSQEKKQKLENILHKKILDEINKFFEKNKNEKIVFVSVPLLFEAGWDIYFDKIIFISADENIRLKRLRERNNYSYDYALKRINSQMKEEEKIKKSDFVIYNNDGFENLKKSIVNIIEILYDY